MHFHRWTKWVTYEENGIVSPWGGGKPIPYADTRQRRSCAICGYVQDEKLKSGGDMPKKESAP